MWLGAFSPTMTAKKKTPSRHGKLADTTTQISISMKGTLLEKAKLTAEEEGRSFSNWVGRLIDEDLKRRRAAAEKDRAP